ncbi:MAG: ThuA domain-containing protein [Armatimonadetes bacterium]|nr:ThuA domain-containing protein [Armatimonadota bacterium]
MHRVGKDVRARIDSALPAAAPAVASRPRRLLVTNLNTRDGVAVDGGHPSIEPGNYALAQLGAVTGAYVAYFADDVRCFAPEQLAAFDAVCLNNTCGVLTDDPVLRAGLLDFVAGGGGLIGLHAAAATFCQYPHYDQFPAFGQMLGGYENGGHPWGPEETIVLSPVDPNNPINAAFGGADFEVQDEVFQMREHYDRGRLRVLLAINTDKTDMSPTRYILPERRADLDLAISWVRRHERGRVFYSSLGHNPHIFWNPPLLAHFLAGMQYALGDLAAEDHPLPA